MECNEQGALMRCKQDQIEQRFDSYAFDDDMVNCKRNL